MGTVKINQLTALRLCDLDRDVSAFLIDRQARGLSPRRAVADLDLQFTLQHYRKLAMWRIMPTT